MGILNITGVSEAKGDLLVTVIEHGGTTGTHLWVEANPLKEKGPARLSPMKIIRVGDMLGI